ncbi:beta-lactamase [Hirsutella rhossiliensis]|uniref:Beta-lactamase domain-containing protein n=1 Tax=Hirsutella rhossiliensis TaxID=111463 RepID=A0A9P8SD23_9HYPO|nr:beta-lactamase domain-containing protein [Hirsutella rhossiliensis]KAH0958156.1 beta-lactamase domain-containing protein [Hirsutella rhossiliensis]
MCFISTATGLALILSLLPAWATWAFTAPNGGPFTRDFSAYVEQVMDEWKVPGLAIAVIDGDDVFTQAFGFAELPNIKATPETLFFAGSTTKAMTAAALSHMIDTKNHSSLAGAGWATPISSLIRDDFVVAGDEWATAHLTLDDAVSHRTGMAPHEYAWARRSERGGEPLTIAAVVRRLRGLKLSAEPRTTWQYSHLMYVALSHVIETLTGKWLGDHLRETIFGPLNMTATYCDTQQALDAPQRLASGYHWDQVRRRYGLVDFDDVRPGSGAGFVISNVVDYAKWIKCLLHESAPFSRQTHADIKTPRMIAAREARSGPGETLYGLGWQRKVAHGAAVYMHGGTEVAYATQVFWLPEQGYGVVAMANVAAPGNAAEETIAWRLMEDKLRVSKEARFNISEHMRAAAEKEARDMSNAVDMMYPTRPDPPLPPPVHATQLVGSYFDEGYGVLDIEEAKGRGKGKGALVARRDDMLFMYTLRFKHVSGGFWLLEVWYDDTDSMAAFWGGEFVVGVDGSVAGLMVQLGAVRGGGRVWFERNRTVQAVSRRTQQ